MNEKTTNNISKTLRGLLVALVVITSARSTHAQLIAPQWNIAGNWDINYGAESGLYDLSFTVVSENLATGAFSAVDNTHGETFSGTVSGSNITFSDFQFIDDSFGNPFENIVSIDGTINPFGTMSGPMVQYNGGTGWTGSYWTISGEAGAIPEPSTYAAIIAAAVLGFAVIRRKRLIT